MRVGIVFVRLSMCVHVRVVFIIIMFVGVITFIDRYSIGVIGWMIR